MRVIELIGFWRPLGPPPWGLDVQRAWPDPSKLVDNEWEADRRGSIAGYLEAGRVIARYFGYSVCRICGLSGGKMGTTDLSDGVWLWPAGLSHYVRAHGVRLPDEVVQTMAANGFIVPPLPDGDFARSTGFWNQWSARMAPHPPMTAACTLVEAGSVAKDLSNSAVTFDVGSAFPGTWRLVLAFTDPAFHWGQQVDFTEPISLAELRAWFLRRRVVRPEDALHPDRANELAAEHGREGTTLGIVAGMEHTTRVGWVAYRVEQRGAAAELLARPFENSRTFSPDGVRLEEVFALDEKGWRYLLEDWTRSVDATVSIEEARRSLPRAFQVAEEPGGQWWVDGCGLDERVRSPVPRHAWAGVSRRAWEAYRASTSVRRPEGSPIGAVWRSLVPWLARRLGGRHAKNAARRGRDRTVTP